MGKHDANKFKEQEFGEIITFGTENNDGSNKHHIKK